MFCSKCGTKAADNAAFCSKCGAALVNQNAPGHNTPPPVPPASPPTGAYIWVPLNALPTQNGVPAAGRWGTMPALNEQGGTLPAKKESNVSSPKPEREKVPDPTFSKFIDAPDPPLPFWYAKIGIGAISILVAIWTFIVAYKKDTLRRLILGVDGHIPGIYLIILIILLFGGAICCFLSKRSKGAAGCGALFQFFAAAFSFFQYFEDDFMEGWLVGTSVLCLAFAVVMLISAAGGIQNFDLDN